MIWKKRYLDSDDYVCNQEEPSFSSNRELLEVFLNIENVSIDIKSIHGFKCILRKRSSVTGNDKKEHGFVLTLESEHEQLFGKVEIQKRKLYLYTLKGKEEDQIKNNDIRFGKKRLCSIYFNKDIITNIRVHQKNG